MKIQAIIDKFKQELIKTEAPEQEIKYAQSLDRTYGKPQTVLLIKDSIVNVLNHVVSTPYLNNKAFYFQKQIDFEGMELSSQNGKKFYNIKIISLSPKTSAFLGFVSPIQHKLQ